MRFVLLHHVSYLVIRWFISGVIQSGFRSTRIEFAIFDSNSLFFEQIFMKCSRNFILFRDISYQVVLVRQFSLIQHQDSLHRKYVLPSKKVTSALLHTSTAAAFHYSSSPGQPRPLALHRLPQRAARLVLLRAGRGDDPRGRWRGCNMNLKWKHIET